MPKSCNLIAKNANFGQFCAFQCINLTFKHEKREGKYVKPSLFSLFPFHKEHLMKKQIPRMVNQSLKGVAPFATGRIGRTVLGSYAV